VKRVPGVKKGLDAALINVPLWGALHKDRALARFTHVLNDLYAAGVPQAQAWDAACLTVRNSAIADRLRRVGLQASSAAGVGERIASSGLFEPEEVALAASGEKTGQVPHVMANMSSNRSDQASARKTRNRLSSVVTLELTAGVMVIYVFWKVVSSYCAFAEIAAALVGQ
jgi:type II secretory pathway component PulF